MLEYTRIYPNISMSGERKGLSSEARWAGGRIDNPANTTLAIFLVLQVVCVVAH
jgi:hypothetical protein